MATRKNIHLQLWNTTIPDLALARVSSIDTDLAINFRLLYSVTEGMERISLLKLTNCGAGEQKGASIITIIIFRKKNMPAFIYIYQVQRKIYPWISDVHYL